MTFEPNELDRIKDAFAPLPPDSQGQHGCPPSEVIWDAAHGNLPAEQVRALVLHAARCSACASAWRMANEARAVVGRTAPAISVRVPARSYRVWGLAAALACGLVAVGVFMTTRDRTTVVERTQSERPLEALLGDHATLPRNNFMLRWTDAGSGALYRVEVARENLESIYNAAGLTMSHVTVPASALEGVTTGAVLYWRVSAVLPDGRVVEGTTHTVTLE
ncbi:MAG: hypothetical protein U0V87_06380 [Acidobacteriota bacterium]